MDDSPGEITELLARARSGDAEAEARLIYLIQMELRRVAERYMHRERPDHTLQATALVNEAYLRLTGQDQQWKSRTHFFAVAAKVMRQVLVDHARRHRAEKRGGALQKVDLENLPLFSDDYSERMVALDEALSRLTKWGPRQSRVVELRFFAGLTEKEVAEVLGVSVRSVKRDWQVARAWLHSEIGSLNP